MPNPSHAQPLSFLQKFDDTNPQLSAGFAHSLNSPFGAEFKEFWMILVITENKKAEKN